jgi:hypothetical protein
VFFLFTNFYSLQVMKKLEKYLSPTVEITVTLAEAGFAASQQKPADWDDM